MTTSEAKAKLLALCKKLKLKHCSTVVEQGVHVNQDGGVAHLPVGEVFEVALEYKVYLSTIGWFSGKSWDTAFSRLEADIADRA